MITSTGLAVAQKMRQTSWHPLMALRTLIGKISFIRIINVCPAPILSALSTAIFINSSSVPVFLIRQGPEDSLKATPNLGLGVDPMIISYKSSMVLIKWVGLNIFMMLWG